MLTKKNAASATDATKDCNIIKYLSDEMMVA